MVTPDSASTALLLIPLGCVVVNRTLGTEEADGIRFCVLPSRAPSRLAMVQFGRTFLQTYPDHSMTREYNAFYSEQHCA